jgi:hypothetical protein
MWLKHLKSLVEIGATQANGVVLLRKSWQNPHDNNWN